MKTKFSFQWIMHALLILFITGNIFSIPDQSVSAKPLFAPFTTCASQTQIPELECDALAALYNNTDGTNWTNNIDWLQTDTPCGWYGVSCNGDGNVIALTLPSNNLTGNIPPELDNLTYLRDIDFYNNHLNGSIPSELGSLLQLRNLRLSSNQLTGEIPAALSDLTQLVTLLLDHNSLTGSIPSGLADLLQLTSLQLYANQLSGSIPPGLGNLTQLTDLYLGDNQLTGPIPPELGALSQLNILHLGNGR